VGNARREKLISFMTSVGKTKTIHYISNTVYLPKMWSTYSDTFMASHGVGDSEAMNQEILATYTW
jgi:hypothetical protein